MSLQMTVSLNADWLEDLRRKKAEHLKKTWQTQGCTLRVFWFYRFRFCVNSLPYGIEIGIVWSVLTCAVSAMREKEEEGSWELRVGV